MKTVISLGNFRTVGIVFLNLMRCLDKVFLMRSFGWLCVIVRSLMNLSHNHVRKKPTSLNMELMNILLI
ncbi:hypothetical protein CFR74_12380 [Novacetimonas hansenii]|nr:hypothetical protein CFR74_12380 [Novacetimonas hansenii]